MPESSWETVPLPSAMAGLPRDRIGRPVPWFVHIDDQGDAERGNVVRINGQAGVLGPRQAAAARAAGQKLYLPHAASCPFANRWARGKAGG